ncbi:MAG: helix-turn-helix domain-containing protein [Actinobacteria bacterium]|jgi:predicted ArsR family transcriptional regulator|nr:helix-turn-helix domain-containing protein [Actinomycetota bacterium]MCL6104058.1 helix-turn-helix domain-containing protein [Actinomycetota bacterium]
MDKYASKHIKSEKKEEAAIQNDNFVSTMAAATSAFGDPTRRQIYLYARAHTGITALEVAKVFSLHPNVARHHLERLSAGGYLEIKISRRKPQGAGRPSKRYFLPEKDVVQEFLLQRAELLVLLLKKSLSFLGPAQAEQIAEEVGREYGYKLGCRISPNQVQRSIYAAMGTVADALTAHGFAAHTEQRGVQTAVVSECCPFGEAATQYPVICAIDRGLIQGMLTALCGQTEAASITMSSKAKGDSSCAILA